MENGDEKKNVLQSLIYDSTKPSLVVLDQLLIPAQKVYVQVPDIETTWAVIRNMQIRGAPLIAVVANLGLAIDLQTNPKTVEGLNNCADAAALTEFLRQKLDYLSTSRPTAVNLFHALADIQAIVDDVVVTGSAQSDNGSGDIAVLRQTVVTAIKEYAEFALQRDVEDNKSIGRHGADELLNHVVLPANSSMDVDDSSTQKLLTLMTICNTGSLATAGYGTALGIVRAVHERHRLGQVVALETRPYNQGSRLTAFEMAQEAMPRATLISDSMAAAFMNNFPTDAVVVGADRVCANGDTANKIGTYNLALVAAAHQVPFYVAAPFTTLDLTLERGSDIVIEERPPSELLQSSHAPLGDDRLGVWNPAFDVTPHKYISGIVTEKGIIRPDPGGTFNIRGFVKSHMMTTTATSSSSTPEEKKEGAATSSRNQKMLDRKVSFGEGTKEAAAMDAAPVYHRREFTRKLSAPIDYTELTTHTMVDYLVRKAPEACAILGTTNPDDMECKEVGDGNLNLVFIVNNKKDAEKQVIAKQALPYVRVVGESWPMTLERSYFEYKALTAHKEACPEHVPSIYYMSKSQALMVMEYLKPPYIILRKGLIEGIKYPTMAHDVGVFCAKSLFKTSGFKLTPAEMRARLEFWSKNTEMCALTEQVVFTEPYMQSANNRWTTPQLDADKKAIEDDVELKIAAAQLKHKFSTETQALIHADLHTGSIMCCPEPGKTYVIDPEFAVYGPMGFDLGAFIAEMFLAYCSQPGHVTDDPSVDRDEYAEWILQQIQVFWCTFTEQFKALWNDPMEHLGYRFGRQTLESVQEVEQAQAQFFDYLWTETMGFAGMKVLRRIVGISHVEDMETIQDIDLKVKCERHAIEFAKELIKKHHSKFSGGTVEEVLELARSKKQQ